MKNLSKNRILYAAGAIFFAALFLSDAIDMILQWDNYTMPKVIRTSIRLLVWIAMTGRCANEYRHRLKRNKDIKNSLHKPLKESDDKEVHI